MNPVIYSADQQKTNELGFELSTALAAVRAAKSIDDIDLDYATNLLARVQAHIAKGKQVAPPGLPDDENIRSLARYIAENHLRAGKKALAREQASAANLKIDPVKDRALKRRSYEAWRRRHDDRNLKRLS